MSVRKESPGCALIPQWYAGRGVLITGSTGFMGKVLVERLLWTCPNIGRLFLLMRQKRDSSPEKRLAQLKSSQVFDVIRKRCPSQLDKLFVVPGDTAQPDLGISTHSLSLLREVSVVFHLAATLKFDEALRKAVRNNVLSVMRLLDICDRLPNVQGFVYVSTAFTNSEHACVEERVYPQLVPLPQVLALTDAVPEAILAEITTKFIAPKQNTYLFTKALAEVSIEEHVNRYYPVAIFRPTIVVSALRHPYPGWVEGMSGSVGLLASIGKGLLRIVSFKLDVHADLLPVDIAIDTLIAVAWETAMDKLQSVRVYNCSTCENPTTWGQFKQNVLSTLRNHPFDAALWKPMMFVVSNRCLYKLCEILLQTAPLYVIEYTNRLRGKRSRVDLIEWSQRIQPLTKVISYFGQREWFFASDNVGRLRSRLSPGDAALYNLDVNTINWAQLYRDFVKGTRKYILKEKDDITEAKRHSNRLCYLHYTALSVFFILVYKFIVHNIVLYIFV